MLLQEIELDFRSIELPGEAPIRAVVDRKTRHRFGRLEADHLLAAAGAGVCNVALADELHLCRAAHGHTGGRKGVRPSACVIKTRSRAGNRVPARFVRQHAGIPGQPRAQITLDPRAVLLPDFAVKLRQPVEQEGVRIDGAVVLHREGITGARVQKCAVVDGEQVEFVLKSKLAARGGLHCRDLQSRIQRENQLAERNGGTVFHAHGHARLQGAARPGKAEVKLVMADSDLRFIQRLPVRCQSFFPPGAVLHVV